MAIEQIIPAYIIDQIQEQERLRKDQENQKQLMLDPPIQNE